MAHVTTPRWLSPVSRRIVVIVIAAAAALMLLTSILITSASAADPIRVRNVQGDACQSTRLGVDAFGVDAFEVVIPRGDADANYSRTFTLPNGGELTLSAPPNRAFVDFSMTGATADGGILFNRTDQKDGNLYDYRPEGGVTEGRLEPPPRDQGNEKQVVFCLGATASLSITATLNGIDVPADPTPVVTNPLTWVFTVTNTGGLPVSGVDVIEGGIKTMCSIDYLAPRANGTCTALPRETGLIDGSVVERTFVATGTDPDLEDVTASTGPISYLVGLACLASTTTGGLGLADDPYAAFWAGPSKEVGPCPAVAISLSAEVIGEDQIVRVEPADGFAWDGATGLVTIEWDAVAATNSEVPRTRQALGDTLVVVPWCDEVVGIALVDDEWFYELTSDTAIYPGATSGGDICLVLQSTTPVAPGLVQTTEVFYIWDDPVLFRPK